MSTQAKEKCPLCLETMDLTDKQLKPCKCGYEICLWCWHRIMEMDQKDECGGRCPGCRSIYNKERVLGTSASNQILKEHCADKSNLQKRHTNSQKKISTNDQLRLAEEQIDPNIARVIHRKLVYIVGMPSEFASDKILKQKKFLGQYGKIENIIIDNVGACQQSPNSCRVYVTFSREEEAVQCIKSVNGFILDGRLLKATFGVTKYCHMWLCNKVCRKPNCNYVHKKARAEDICTKDNVSLVCARLPHSLGIDMKGPQQCSANSLPCPANSRATVYNANSKDKICINDSTILPKAVNKNLGTLPAAIPRDSNVFSRNSSSIVNGALRQQNSHESILNNQQKGLASKSQELPPLGPKIDDSWRKPQNANAVSQQSSSQRFTVLTRELMSTETRSKATEQVRSGVSNFKKLTVPKDQHVSLVPRCQSIKVVPQRREEPPHKLIKQISSAAVKCHAGAEKENGCSDISGNPGQGKHMQLNMRTASQSLSGSTTAHSALSQISHEIDKLSDSHRKLASENNSGVLNQQKSVVANKVVVSESDYRKKIVSTDDKHPASARGDHIVSLENGEDTKQSNSVSTSSTLSSTDTILSSTQHHGFYFGASSHCLSPPNPGGLLQRMVGVQNPMKCCTFQSLGSAPNQKPEYWNSSVNGYMAPGGYDSFFQNTPPDMKAGMVGTLLQQSLPSLRAESTNGSADAGYNGAQVDHSYPKYTLF